MKKRERSSFECSECGHAAAKWLGKCPSCGAWNSFVEIPPSFGSGGAAGHDGESTATGRQSVSLSEIDVDAVPQRPTEIGELDRVLGGGITPGGSVLLGGPPGIGKSTLMLQLAARSGGARTLYVTAEEPLHQVGRRAQRLGVSTDSVEILSTTQLEEVQAAVLRRPPEILIIDSIQTLYTREAGTVPGLAAQVRSCSFALLEWGREHGASVFLIAHVTKEGSIAGPKLLEHMVDTVLYFEETEGTLRVVRAAKNRFGPTDEVALFRMNEKGLAEVADPGGAFMTTRTSVPPGVAVAPVFEGSRVFLVEVQALTVPAKSGVSRTYSDRVDSGRVSRVAAVLEKHLGVSFSDQDLYVNIAGGLKVREVGIELPLAMALYSARMGIPLPSGTAIIGEVSLAGEVRPVGHTRGRAKAARDLGYARVIAPSPGYGEEDGTVSWDTVETVADAVKRSFGAKASAG
ncbi:MAG: DNA repair protein RadA [Spirochaetes bacterium]|jgi:DNA repair protein RadA/Sms|nr:DNA repair protein RadA [Spirochaetota bacterium]